MEVVNSEVKNHPMRALRQFEVGVGNMHDEVSWHMHAKATKYEGRKRADML